jgi:hypothetical protein
MSIALAQPPEFSLARLGLDVAQQLDEQADGRAHYRRRVVRGKLLHGRIDVQCLRLDVGREDL